VTLLLFSALLATLAGAFVIRPLLVRRGALLVDVAPGAVLDAEARRRVALASLTELEYDFVGGKLDEADYRAQRERLGLEALAAIRASEAMGGGAPAAESDRHACSFVNPAGSRFCAGCGTRL